jgi:hypothetical protein
MKFVFKANKNFGKGVPKFKTMGKNGNPDGGEKVMGGGKRKFLLKYTRDWSTIVRKRYFGLPKNIGIVDKITNKKKIVLIINLLMVNVNYTIYRKLFYGILISKK